MFTKFYPHLFSLEILRFRLFASSKEISNWVLYILSSLMDEMISFYQANVEFVDIWWVKWSNLEFSMEISSLLGKSRVSHAKVFSM